MTWVYLGALGVVVALLVALGRPGAAEAPTPPRWDEISVCLDCGARDV